MIPAQATTLAMRTMYANLVMRPEHPVAQLVPQIALHA